MQTKVGVDGELHASDPDQRADVDAAKKPLVSATKNVHSYSIALSYFCLQYASLTLKRFKISLKNVTLSQLNTFGTSVHLLGCLC